VGVQATHWRSRIGWLWLTLLGPIVGGIVAPLSPFASSHAPWPSRLGGLLVLAAVWLGPLLLIWPLDRD
jgi:hypothetical protein